MSVVSTQQRPQQHIRSRSNFSFRSTKSDKSHRSRKFGLKETHEEKARNHLNDVTKANPNAALNEIQPNVAALQQATLAPLRAVQHKDGLGNVITEPDLSNPTRSRWERPLDTIRSFEASIEGDYNRKSMLMRADTKSEMNDIASRRNSFYQDHNYQNRHNYPNSQRFPPGFHSSNGNRGLPNGGNYGNIYNHSHGAAHHKPPHKQRTQIEQPPKRNLNSQIYPSPGYQRSRDAIEFGASSPSEQWNNSTEPSSENSSIDRVKPDAIEQHQFIGFNGIPQGSSIDEYNGRSGGPYPEPAGTGQGPSSTKIPGAHSNQGYQNTSAPLATSPNGQTSIPIKLGGHPTGVSDTPMQQQAEKKKGWFKKRFSRDGDA